MTEQKDVQDGISRLKKTILSDYPRMTSNDRFRFVCNASLSCFNKCCRDVTIFLTPYDILRMKNRLGISSQEFLAQYTVSPFSKDTQLPVVVLKMREDAEKTCPFVDKSGCTIYEDRPWPCRMYPLGVASSKATEQDTGEEFYFLMQDDVCEGLKEDKEWAVLEWMDDQGIKEYDELGALFKEINLHPHFQEGKSLEPQKMEMYYMVCYNLDKFRRFLFDSTFFDRFEIDDRQRDAIMHDDVALLKYGFNWLKFSLFGQKTMNIKQDTIDRMKKGDS